MIRITIPAEVAFDIGKVHTVIDNLARRLGCGECLSGRSCVLIQEHEFIVRPQDLEVRGLPAKGGSELRSSRTQHYLRGNPPELA